MQLNKALYRTEQALAQAGFVRATGRRRDQIDVRLAYDIAFFRPRDDPSRTFAFGKAIRVCGRILLTLEKRNQQVAATTLRERLI